MGDWALGKGLCIPRSILWSIISACRAGSIRPGQGARVELVKNPWPVPDFEHQVDDCQSSETKPGIRRNSAVLWAQVSVRVLTLWRRSEDHWGQSVFRVSPTASVPCRTLPLPHHRRVSKQTVPGVVPPANSYCLGERVKPVPLRKLILPPRPNRAPDLWAIIV